jgi:hypothetical protein
MTTKQQFPTGMMLAGEKTAAIQRHNRRKQRQKDSSYETKHIDRSETGRARFSKRPKLLRRDNNSSQDCNDPALCGLPAANCPNK